MDFGNTIEEQYAKIVAINKLCEKFIKAARIISICMGAAMLMLAFSSSDEIIKLLLLSVMIFVVLFLMSGFLGRTYCWAWILLCEKYNPKHLAFSFADAVDNSAVYGYVFGDSSGAKEGAFGAVAVMFIFAAFYLHKGQKYAKKYKNLPKKELELKKQLEAKYGKTL